MTYLIILNDAPYESERNYNALRLATSLAANPENTVWVFLVGDAVLSAATNHTVPEGRHDIEWMLKRFAAAGGAIGVCRTCMEARAMVPEDLLDGARRSTLDELTAWTAEAGKVLVF